MLFQVDYDRFIEELNIEGITNESKDKLEVEDLGTMFAFYLNSIDRNKEFVFVVGKSEFTPVQQAQLAPISKKSVRIREDFELKKINEKLERIEKNLTPAQLIETQVITNGSTSD